MKRLAWISALLLPACAGDDAARAPAPTDLATLERISAAPVVATWDPSGRPSLVTGEFAAAGGPEAAARGFLADHAALLALDPDGLELIATRRGLAGSYLRFQQTVAGLPVFDGQVVVAMSPGADRVRAVSLNQRALAGAPDLATDLGAAAALAAARTHLGGPIEVRRPTVVRGLDASDLTPRLAYRVEVVTARATWDVGVDGATGAIRWSRDRNVSADGTGLVFDPNPIQSTGDTSLVDNNDATSPALDAARLSVTLRNLDGSGVLRGLWADVRPPTIAQRATSAGLAFNYDRADNRFEEVVTYFHLDRAQTRIQALGFTDVNHRVQVAIVNDGNQDNSFYSPGTKQLSFGAGGVDDAEDGEIVLHEYGHSIHDNQVPGWGGGNQGAMGEGFGDYLAASFAATFRPGPADQACVGDWDAISYDTRTPRCLRRLDEPKHWPEDGTGGVHADGELWSAALWRGRGAVGGDVMDRLVIESHFLLGTSASFDQAANAILAADRMVLGGAHQAPVRRALYHTGMLRTVQPPATFSTVVSTMPLDVRVPTTGSYANNLDDVKTVTVPGAAALRVHFATLDTETAASCLDGGCDNVYLFDGAGDLYQILSGNRPDTTSVQIPGDTIRVRLVTNRSGQRTGYRIDRVDVMGGTQPTDAAVDAPAVVVDAGVDAPAPVIDAAIDAPAPVIDAAIDAPAPPVDASGDGAVPNLDATPVGPDAGGDDGDDTGGCCQTGTGVDGSALAIAAVAAGLARRRRRATR